MTRPRHCVVASLSLQTSAAISVIGSAVTRAPGQERLLLVVYAAVMLVASREVERDDALGWTFSTGMNVLTLVGMAPVLLGVRWIEAPPPWVLVAQGALSVLGVLQASGRGLLAWRERGRPLPIGRW